MSRWKPVLGEIYKANPGVVQGHERVGIRSTILEEVTARGADEVIIKRKVLLNTWDTDFPPMPFYEEESQVFKGHEINTDLRRGCLPGTRKGLRWTPDNT